MALTGLVLHVQLVAARRLPLLDDYVSGSPTLGVPSCNAYATSAGSKLLGATRRDREGS